jgi:hypothetical protein
MPKIFTHLKVCTVLCALELLLQIAVFKFTSGSTQKVLWWGLPLVICAGTFGSGYISRRNADDNVFSDPHFFRIWRQSDLEHWDLFYAISASMFLTFLASVWLSYETYIVSAGCVLALAALIAWWAKTRFAAVVFGSLSFLALGFYWLYGGSFRDDCPEAPECAYSQHP